MFGIGIGELLVIFLVALLVLGPDKLPEIARTLARLVGEFRRVSDELKRNVVTADQNNGWRDLMVARKSLPEPEPKSKENQNG